MEQLNRRQASRLLASVALSAGGLRHAFAQTEPDVRVPASTLPADVESTHEIGHGATALRFKARAGALRISIGGSAATFAEMAFVSFERDTGDAAKRPIVFAINGGPGAASAWLSLGAVAPWRLRMDAKADMPSITPTLVENAETWLPFADLVMIDTPGTGYSRVAPPNAGAAAFYNVSGDIDALAAFIRGFLTKYGRLASPKYIVAESYGGIRAPRLAQSLARRDNVGIRGLILVSPVLSMSVIDGSSLIVDAARLPSYAAINKEARTRAALAGVETYATGDYIVDLLKGPRVAAAQSRVALRVAAITGLNETFVRRSGGRIERSAFVREKTRATGQVMSIYDANVLGMDPTPNNYFSEWDDPMLDALRAPLGAAATMLVTETLKWPVGEARYEVLNYDLARRWSWGSSGRLGVESISALRELLAGDPAFRVTIAHGLYDLVTPYLGSKILIDQMPSYGNEMRIKLVTYPSGHMLYASDIGRAGLRDEARLLIARA